ncbi:hypothetical protein SLEP1_g39856 [Rubroshorea leprosula]|uniref:Leucine-rich repeat-containing N-terminal plant-type domain-containing protein n=1 Tax=Rubroshorea leprosula TaxID=152421 RepID=A0AAV5L1J1_9ROSI|nr:hypothetical protein SLEP1_g39856 [Rubroshorea leprosula]
MFVLVAVLFFGIAEFCSGRNTSFSCIEREREALLKLKLCFHDPSHMLSSWKGNDCCEWRGVGCDKNGHHVVSIQLKGSIFDQPQLYLIDNVEEVVSSLLMLKYLEHLDLSRNYFNKSLIPHSFGLMKQLRYLNLSHAHFRGRIPSELGNLTRLRVLDLADYYGGALKVDDDIQWISHLSFLQQLDMSGVNLMLASSNLFQVLGMPPLLSWLSLSGCNLKNSHLPSGEMVGGLERSSECSRYELETMDLGENNISGLMPNWLGELKRLIYLNLSSNAFVGPIPSSLGTISSLRELVFQ